MSQITNHAYDSGPVNTGAPCIAERGGGREVACGRLEHEHKYSEYVDTTPGAMHEPPEYQSDEGLDWHASLAHRDDE